MSDFVLWWIGFLGTIVVCVCFYSLGFIEGIRQSMKETNHCRVMHEDETL